MERLGGMRGFTLVWLGQLVSLLGSGMTRFAFGIWIFQQTGQATEFALTLFFAMGPSILLSPFAGALVDRWNRKLVLILSDLAAGLATLVLLALFWMEGLQIWHLYAVIAFSSAFDAFQFPAYSAAVTLMIPKEQYGRASGMLSLAGAASGIFAPIVASALIGWIGIGGIMGIDILTFVFAILMLLIIHVPQPVQSAEGRAGSGNLLRESGYGFQYIIARPSLLGLQLVFLFMNLVAMFSFAVSTPMILSRSGNNEILLGIAQSVGSMGGLAGGVLMSTWGGPKRRVHGVLFGMVLVSMFGLLPLGIGQTIFFWAAGGFAIGCFIPILNGSNQAIWQAKVAPDVQGRVFAARRVIAQAAGLISVLAAGPLADRVFEPAMSMNGLWNGSLGWLVGTGPGAGMGLMFVLTGLAGIGVGLLGYLIPAVRNVEDIMPDHEAAAPSPAPA